MKISKSIITLFLMSLFLFLGMSSARAQMKIRFINSQRILDEYPALQEVQKQIDDLKKKYEDEFNKKQQEGQTLLDEIQNQSLLLSPEKKAEKEARLQSIQMELERFYVEKFGPQGELFKKKRDLEQPIIDKINGVIQRIGQEEGYDFVLDSVQGLLYAKDEYDITERVLEELSKAK